MVSDLALTRSRGRTKTNLKLSLGCVLFLSITLTGMFLMTASIGEDEPILIKNNINILKDDKSRNMHHSPATVKKNHIRGHENLHGVEGKTGVYSHGDQILHHANVDKSETVQELNVIRPDWSPLGGGRFPEYKDGTNVFIRPASPDVVEKHDAIARTRREAVKNAMKHAWGGYKTYAWGEDEVLPLSKSGHDNWGGMGTTLVDSLDTLWLMGMKDEFWEARDWVRDNLAFDNVGQVSVFETTIRSLGGLLSAYDWSGDDIFLEKALDLGTRLSQAFDTRSGIPAPLVSLNSRRAQSRVNTSVGEAGTLQVEFRYLAKATGKTDFATKSQRVFELLQPLQYKYEGLFPWGISSTPSFTNDILTVGGRADSFYEYMLKIWLQGGKTEPMYREMYDRAIAGLHKQLLHKTTDEGLTYIALKQRGMKKHEMDHLACFMAGSLVLGAYTDPLGLDSARAQRDLQTGKALCYTCYQMYARTKTGLGPEIEHFNDGKFIGNEFSQKGSNFNPSTYILRPEVMESFFILNQLTGDPMYREWGWEVFQAIEHVCKTDIGYGGKKDVDIVDSEVMDKMESFFLGETLKYSYLLQDPDTEVDILNKHVFNTEAHPTRVFPIFDNEMKSVNR